MGIREEDVDAVWADLNMSPGHAVGLCVRSIRTCPGIQYCRLATQDALGVGLKLDAAYHGMVLPNKMKMAVSGCNLNCSESVVRDIGLVGKAQLVGIIPQQRQFAKLGAGGMQHPQGNVRRWR